MKTKRFKFSIIELILVIGLSMVSGAFVFELIDAVVKGEPYSSLLGTIAFLVLPLATLIVRSRIRIIEIKTKI